MKKLKNFLIKNTWLILLIFAIPAVWALFVPGFYGASDDMHIAWLNQMDRSLKAGQFPPRFVPDLSYGFGYPLFNFVFPLPFYLGEIFHLTGFSLVDSLKLVFGLTTLFSGYGMYLLLREFLDKRLALAGSVLYIYTPYRATDLYVRGALGEIVAFSFLPLVFLSLLKILKGKGGLKWVGIGAFSLACLILSHNITAYMAVFFLGVFLLVCCLVKRKLVFPGIGRTILFVVLSLFISAYFWLPAISESGLLKYDTVFNYQDHFPTVRQLIMPYFGYGASVPGPYDGMSFFLGAVNIIVIIGGSILFALNYQKFKNLEKAIFMWSCISLAISILMMNHRSTFIWESIPFIRYFQFPWRFLIMTTFIAPIFLLPFKFVRGKIILTVIILLGVMTTCGYFRPQDFLGRGDGYYLDRYIPYPSASEAYRKTSEEYLRLPKTTKIRPSANMLLLYADGELNTQIVEHDGINLKAKVMSVNDLTVNYSKYYFPGWQVQINGYIKDIAAGNPFGQVQFNVPKGKSEIKITYRETPARLILDIVSLLSFFAALFLIFGGGKIIMVRHKR